MRETDRKVHQQGWTNNQRQTLYFFMGNAQKKKVNKRIALILVTLQALQLLKYLLYKWQVQYQLISPLIPKKVITDLIGPSQYLLAATICTLIIALLFFAFSKNIISIVISGLALAGSFIFDCYNIN